MSERVSQEDLMRFLDGELAPEERGRVEAALAGSTELRREVAVYRTMKEDLETLPLRGPRGKGSVWHEVNRKLARPVGWILLVTGTVIWLALGAYTWATTPGVLVEKLATGAIVIGILILLASVIWERYVEFLTDPYRDVQR